MVTVLLDLRRARQQRWALVVLSALALALPVLAMRAPGLQAWLVSPAVGHIILAGLTLATTAAVWVWSERSTRWGVADTAAWAALLVTLTWLGARGAAPFTAGMFLHGAALLLLALRAPPSGVILGAVFLTLVGVPVRAVSAREAGPVLAYGLVAALLLAAHVLLAQATHLIRGLLVEREALLNDRRERPARQRERASAPAVSAGAVRALRSAEPRDAEAPTPDDAGWDGLVDRLRASITTLCEDAGVSSTVKAELKGLAPPSSKMRQGVMKVTQEAASHALRETEARRIVITLRRADGGLVLEVEDDGTGNEGGRSRKALAAIRGRVASLGGSAEVRRADLGWVMRVRLPCEQLN